MYKLQKIKGFILLLQNTYTKNEMYDEEGRELSHEQRQDQRHFELNTKMQFLKFKLEEVIDDEFDFIDYDLFCKYLLSYFIF